MAAVRHAGLLCALLICACSGTESSTAKNAGGTLVISVGADPDNLVPALVQSTVGAEVIDMIYDRLADIGDSLNTLGDKGFTPRLADRWTWSNDSLSVAFHLNPAAK